MKKIFTIVLLLLCASFAKAQAFVSVGGHVTNVDNDPVRETSVYAIGDKPLVSFVPVNPFGYYTLYAYTGTQYAIFARDKSNNMSRVYFIFVIDNVENLNFVIEQ